MTPTGTSTRVQDTPAINFEWLLRLRWGTIIGQITIVLIAQLQLGFDLPLAPLCGIIAIEAASNAACVRWSQRAPRIAEWLIGAVMAFDVVLFTGLLLLTGGAFNPFSFLYLVYIALAAVVLPPGWTWTLAVFSLACFAALFFVPRTAPGGPHAEHMKQHLEGMWFAFAVAAGFIVYFVQRVTRALAAREMELAASRHLAARSERLASLATLAAGAAHQLATPLSTIAVVAGELVEQLAGRPDGASAVDDARLIREQVERCREILLQMAADAGESTGEPLSTISAEALLDAARRGLPAGERIRIAADAAARRQSVTTPVRSVAQALRAVLKNALEASFDGGPIDVRLTATDAMLQIAVRDRGSGMPAEVLEHVGEPFFTTKGPDQGMGLGMFLTRTVLEGLGGDLAIDSAPGVGTTVVMRLPCSVAATIDHIAHSADTRQGEGSRRDGRPVRAGNGG